MLNTFFTPTFLWKQIINDYSAYFNKNHKKQNIVVFVMKTLVLKIFWFWPSLGSADSWRDYEFEDVMGAQAYVKLDEQGLRLMNEVISRTKSEDSALLDLGCNIGRFLNYLAEKGYKNINGVDVSKVAIESMGTTFPALSGISSVKLQTMQEYLLNTDANSIDIVYTHGATVELVPATFPLVKEICRICNEYVVFMINENGHLFPRFWEHEFKMNNFDLVKLERSFDGNGNIMGNSLLVFKKRQ